MSKKKTIRLTESELVTLIEGIVNKVKTEKRNAILESTQTKKRALKRRK